MAYHYYMGLELPVSFQALLGGVKTASVSSRLYFSALGVPDSGPAVPFPIPFLVYGFYEMIMNKPVRIVFEKE